MSNTDIVAQTTKGTVVENYIPTGKCSDNYQDIDALAKEFLDLLCHQGYDDRITFDDEEGMVVNLRTNLELLNDYHFTDTEWCRFFNDCIANPDEHILEKSRKLQGDFVQVLTRDDGTTKNILSSFLILCLLLQPVSAFAAAYIFTSIYLQPKLLSYLLVGISPFPQIPN